MDLLEIAKEEKRRRDSGEPPLPPPTPRPRSFAQRTGQAWRLWAAQILLIVCGVAMFVGMSRIQKPFGLALMLGGIAGVFIAFVAQSLAVRCPRCRTAVVWHTFTTRKASEASFAAFYQVSCPKCGYVPD